MFREREDYGFIYQGIEKLIDWLYRNTSYIGICNIIGYNIKIRKVVLHMPDNINSILIEYRENMERIFGDSLVRVILYGSYARGDFNNDSDVDIMILADIGPEKISEYADKVYDISYDFEMDYGLEFNPCVQSVQTFDYWKEVYPFFNNIDKEGIAV